MENLKAVQEMFDYWLSEEGTPDMLREQVIGRLRTIVPVIQMHIEAPDKMLEDLIPEMTVLYKALRELEERQERERETARKLTWEDLMKDYALYIGTAIRADEGNMEDPMQYLDLFISNHAQPPKEECRDFLVQFYPLEPEEVDEWMNKIAWEEDERDDS